MFLTLVYSLEGLGIHPRTTTSCGKWTIPFSLACPMWVPLARLYPVYRTVMVLLCRVPWIQYFMIPIWTGKRFSTIIVQVMPLYVTSILDVICTQELILAPFKHGWIIITTEYINWSSASNRAICRQCRSILWLSSLTCAAPHQCPKNGKDEVKLVPLLPYAVSACLLWSILCVLGSSLHRFYWSWVLSIFFLPLHCCGNCYPFSDWSIHCYFYTFFPCPFI